jgi:hypothetical protein
MLSPFMVKLARKAIPANERAEHFGRTAAKRAEETKEVEVQKSADVDQAITLYVPIVKANDEQRVVTGVVLVPEQVDAHGDIYDSDVVQNAAWDFLEAYQDTTTLGLMHKKFSVDFGLLESYVAPNGLVIADTAIKEGSWVMTVRVKDDAIWQKVKDGKITGFSIGGVAKVKQLKPAEGQ